MVVLIAAQGVIEDATRVALEDGGGLEVHCEWSLGKCSLHLLNVSGGHSRPVSDEDACVAGRVVLAGAVYAHIGVLLLSLGVVALEILKCKERVSTTAAIVLSVTIDKLLLREGDQSSRSHEVSAFESTSGREGPA